METYALHGLTVECSYSLQAAPAAAPLSGTGRRRISVDTRSGPPPAAEVWVQHHHLDGGAIWLSKGRAEGGRGWLVAIRDIACFHIEPGCALIHCHADPGASARDVAYVTENQVVPLVSVLLGSSVVHASAIGCDGRAALFLGPTGRGKSTLALSFAQCEDARLLTDDCATFARGADGTLLEPPSVLPSGAAPRLWPDSFTGLFGTATEGRRGSDYSPKLVVPWHVSGPDDIPNSVALNAVFLLGDSLLDTAERVEIRKTSPLEAALALIRNSLVFNPGDHEASTAQFQVVTHIAKSVPAYVLRYKRGFDVLPSVRSAILRFL